MDAGSGIHLQHRLCRQRLDHVPMLRERTGRTFQSNQALIDRPASGMPLTVRHRHQLPCGSASVFENVITGA